jgi:hypothetical protein
MWKFFKCAFTKMIVRIPERKRLLGRPRRTLKICVIMIRKETGRKGINCNHLFSLVERSGKHGN